MPSSEPTGEDTGFQHRENLSTNELLANLAEANEAVKLAQQGLTQAVRAARQGRSSWKDIAEVLGDSTHAVYERYSEQVYLPEED